MGDLRASEDEYATRDMPPAPGMYATQDPRSRGVLPVVAGASILGRIELLERRGAGGFATVYRARDHGLNRDVAVKILDGGSGRDGVEYGNIVARFERERRVQAMLDEHPNIIRVHQAGEHEGLPVLVLEYMAGPNLAELAAEQRPSAAEIVSVGVQLAAALGHAHARSVIHRDVKPENVLLDAERRKVKLGDFGIAQLPAESQRSAWSALPHPGTPPYMSPEQERGGGYLDARSDIYSLGCTLYQFASGVVYKTERRPLATIRPDLPRRLVAVIDRCLAEAPADRWRHADEVAGALSRIRRFPTLPTLRWPWGRLRLRSLSPIWRAALAVFVATLIGVPLVARALSQSAVPASPSPAATTSLPTFVGVAPTSVPIAPSPAPSATPAPSTPVPTAATTQTPDVTSAAPVGPPPTVQPVALPRATPVPTPAPIAVATPAPVQHVTPASGPAGINFLITVVGLPAGQVFETTYTGGNGKQSVPIPSGIVPVDGVVRATLMTDSSFSPGLYVFRVSAGGISRFVTFQVTP